MIKGVIYSIKQAFKQIFRNKGMSVASVFSITAMMLILALFLFLTVNLNFITENVKDQFGTIVVFLLEDTDIINLHGCLIVKCSRLVRISRPVSTDCNIKYYVEWLIKWCRIRLLL